jgi:hypothetical protein
MGVHLQKEAEPIAHGPGARARPAMVCRRMGDVWRNNPKAVRPWFTRRHQCLASALSSATGIPITVQPWNELAWLTDPSVVADALDQEFEETRPDHVEGHPSSMTPHPNLLA